MFWNYKIIEYDEMFYIHEVYYNDDGRPTSPQTFSTISHTPQGQMPAQNPQPMQRLQKML